MDHVPAPTSETYRRVMPRRRGDRKAVLATALAVLLALPAAAALSAKAAGLLHSAPPRESAIAKEAFAPMATSERTPHGVRVGTVRVAQRAVERRAIAGSPAPLGPLIVSQIHNAPGWRHSHAYSFRTGPYTRVVNGPGWDESSGTYKPGRPLEAYQLISKGSCRSAPSGGPTGTGAAIADGTCTWKHLSPVDYVSITGWAFDGPHWQSGTSYHYYDHVTSGTPLRSYALAEDSCTSRVAPSGDSGQFDGWGKKFQTADGCLWYELADVLYTSGRSYVPTVALTSPKSPAVIRMTASYEAMLWNDREYVAGQRGENSPITLLDHAVNRHPGAEGGPLRGCDAPAVGGTGSGRCHRLIITAAPGESFADRLTPCDPLSGFDPAKGVAVYNGEPNRWPFEPAALFAVDPFVDIVGLQLKSVHGAAFYGNNQNTIRDSILDGGSKEKWTANAAVWMDAGPNVVANSLIISHGPAGIVFKYPGIVLHDTIVNPDHAPDSVGIETGHKWVFEDTVVADTAIFGFTHAGAAGSSGTGFSSRSRSNVTDAPVGDSGITNWMGTPGNYPVVAIPGTTYGAAMAAAFVAPGSDWRAKTPGSLIGRGSAFGSFGTFCSLLEGTGCANYTRYDFDSPDLIGTARPQAGRYDIGAWQSPSSPGEACRPGDR